MAGLTLLELMIALAVLSVVMAVTVPSFRDYTDKKSLQRGAETVAGFIERARSYARLGQVPVAVTMGGQCLGARVGTDPCDCRGAAASCVLAEAGTDVQALLATQDLGSLSLQAAGDGLVFQQPRGAVVAPAGQDLATSVTLAAGRWTLRVDLSGLGAVQLCLPQNAPAIGGYSRCLS
jgi:prepilin-type N-terminal cleavage/methylation domain-containing protein